LSNILTALRLFSHDQQAKSYGSQMNGCNIGGIVIAFLFQ